MDIQEIMNKIDYVGAKRNMSSADIQAIKDSIK